MLKTRRFKARQRESFRRTLRRQNGWHWDDRPKAWLLLLSEPGQRGARRPPEGFGARGAPGGQRRHRRPGATPRGGPAHPLHLSRKASRFCHGLWRAVAPPGLSNAGLNRKQLDPEDDMETTAPAAPPRRQGPRFHCGATSLPHTMRAVASFSLYSPLQYPPQRKVKKI
jgi:hypothetical protein